MRRFVMILAAFIMMVCSVDANENPIEVGSVDWGRDLDKAAS